MTTGQQNNNQDINNVNTQGIRFYNSEGEAWQSTIQLAFWKEKLGIKINPALSKELRTEKAKFDYKQVIQAYVSIDEAIVLKSILEEADAATEDFNKGISIGGDSLIAVKKTAGSDPVLVIYKEIEGESQKCTNFLGYDFNNPATIVDGYSPNGDGEVSVTNKCGEFKAFIALLSSFIYAIGGADVHAMRYHDRFFRAKIAGGSTGGSSSTYSKSNNNVFGGNTNGGQGNNYAPSSNSDLNGFI